MAKDKPNILQRIFGPRNKTITEATTEATTTTSVKTESNKITDRIIKSVATSSVNLNNSIDVLTADERQLMELYEMMDYDAVIAAALDLFADNATLINPKTGHVAAVQSNDLNFQEEINDFLWNIFKVDSEAWNIIRNVAKYGKVVIDTKSTRAADEWAFNIIESPYNIQALSHGQDTIDYFIVAPEKDKPGNHGTNPFAVLYEKTHGENSYRVEPSSRFIVGVNSKRVMGKATIQKVSPVTGQTVTEELKIISGRSVLAPVISTWQTLNTMENALLTNRLTKATQFKIVQVDISDSTNAQAEQILSSVKNAFKNSETLDRNKSSYQNRLAPVPVDDIIVIGKKGEKGAVTVNAVGSEMSKAPMEDIDYMRNKLFAGLGVLKAYLGFEETTPGGLGDSTLTKLDERLSRRVSRFQLILKDILRLVVEHYWSYSRPNRSVETMPEYNIILGKISTREDEAVRESLRDSFDIANSIIALAKDELFAEKIDADKLFTYIFDEVLNLDIAKFDNRPHPDDIKLKVEEIFVEGKYSDLVNTDNLRYLFNGYEIGIIDEEDNSVLLTKALEAPTYKKVLQEATYKDLKATSKSLDPERLAKSKKINVKYTNIDDDGTINFIVSAEDAEKNAIEGKPTMYTTKVLLKDAEKIFNDPDRKGTGVALVRQAINGDIAVSCSCPAAKYWGQEYKGTQHSYSLVKNTIAPTRNTPTQVVCKHTLATLTALPFWNNTFVRDFRAKGLLKPAVKKKVKKTPNLKDVENKKDPAPQSEDADK